MLLQIKLRALSASVQTLGRVNALDSGHRMLNQIRDVRERLVNERGDVADSPRVGDWTTVATKLIGALWKYGRVGGKRSGRGSSKAWIPWGTTALLPGCLGSPKDFMCLRRQPSAWIQPRPFSRANLPVEDGASHPRVDSLRIGLS